MAKLVKRGMGWRPQLPDNRDFKYEVPKNVLKRGLSTIVDLRQWCPPIWDQGQLGSCTAHGISAALQFDAIKAGQYDEHVMHSRLFIYYNERAMEGTVSSDAGADIRDGIKSVATQGACNEKLWWYNIDKFAVKPNKACYKNALKYKSLTYLAVAQDLTTMKGCLDAGSPIVIGFTCYDGLLSDQTAKTGIVPMPAATDTVQGGHCVLLVGYNDATKLFTFRNSWNTSWGDKGYGYLPYAYLTNPNLADDFWTIKSVM